MASLVLLAMILFSFVVSVGVVAKSLKNKGD